MLSQKKDRSSHKCSSFYSIFLIVFWILTGLFEGATEELKWEIYNGEYFYDTLPYGDCKIADKLHEVRLNQLNKLIRDLRGTRREVAFMVIGYFIVAIFVVITMVFTYNLTDEVERVKQYRFLQSFKDEWSDETNQMEKDCGIDEIDFSFRSRGFVYPNYDLQDQKSPSASTVESPPRSSELAARLKIVSLNGWAIWVHRVFSACLTLILLTHILWACLLVGSSPKFMLQLCKSDLDLFNHGVAKCEKAVDLKVLDKLEVIMAWKHADDMQKFVPAMAVVISAFVFFLIFQVVFWKSVNEFSLINKWPGKKNQGESSIYIMNQIVCFPTVFM
ncbi:hypothetical protein M3Y98_00950700 [Aphelenchoides besseyi]|nr:hypothetical protein M3Y98_00950700 [Aphelenchoides besseyi]